MKLALNQGPSGAKSLSSDLDRVLEAERLGYDSVWTSESYGSDAVTTATWMAARTQRIHVGTAIMQMAGRAPAATAMTAMTLDALSGGRFRLGLGVSGPQVVITLCGPRESIRERLAEWKAAGLTTLGVRGKLDAIRLTAELIL